MKRLIVFSKTAGGYTIREYVNMHCEAVYLASFERAYKKMSELEKSGFRNVYHSRQEIRYELA